MSSVAKLGVRKVNQNGEVRMLKTGTIQSRTYQREDQRKWSEKSDRLKSINERNERKRKIVSWFNNFIQTWNVTVLTIYILLCQFSCDGRFHVKMKGSVNGEHILSLKKFFE